MNKKTNLGLRLSKLNQKYGYARVVADRLKERGVFVTERHIYLVVHGYQRKFSDEIELEVERYIIEREKYEAALKAEREALQYV